jgi:hypothetical protein
MNLKSIPLRLPEKLYRKLKVFSAKNDISMNTLVIKALESDFLKAKNAGTIEIEGYREQEQTFKQK